MWGPAAPHTGIAFKALAEVESAGVRSTEGRGHDEHRIPQGKLSDTPRERILGCTQSRRCPLSLAGAACAGSSACAFAPSPAQQRYPHCLSGRTPAIRRPRDPPDGPVAWTVRRRFGDCPRKGMVR